jgi:serine phosphatase RsbU (regulator of sigma subunit)
VATDAETIIELRKTISDVHATLMPTQFDLPQVTDVTFDVVYKAAKESERFGGDWYKVQTMAKWQNDGTISRDDVLAISLGDVAGHGMNAAMVMMRVVQTLQAAILAEHEPPSAVLSKANQMLNLDDRNPLVTALFGYLNIKAGTFEYATAGQMPPLWVSRDGHAEYLPTNGIPLCCERQLITSDQFTHMPPGSSIVLFSDGLVEQKHTNLIQAMEKLRLIAAEELPKFNPHPAEAIFDKMWKGVEHLDDVAILTFTMKNKVDVTPKVPSAQKRPEK